jgi:hypothetical protein
MVEVRDDHSRWFATMFARDIDDVTDLQASRGNR